MSASREKKTRHQLLSEGMSEKEIKTYLEAEKSGLNTKLYTAGAVILGVAMVASVVWNTGIVQNGAVAANVNGVEYTVAELDYYYNTAKQNELYMGYYGMSAFNPNLSAHDQMKVEDQTYHEYFIEEALVQVKSTQALNDVADENNFVLADEDVAQIAATVASMENEAIINGYPNAEGYLKASYGPYMTIELLEKVIEDQLTAVLYSTEYGESLVYDDATLDAYYAEHQDMLDTYNLSYVVLRAEAPIAAEGETLTEEQILAEFEAEKLVQKDAADAVKLAMEAGEDIETLGDEYDAYGAYNNQFVIGSSLNDSYSEWAFDATRKAGDISIQEYESDDMHIYYVLRFDGRELNETATADIRHILVGAAAQGEIPTDEDYAAAKTKADELLATFVSGEATPESFGALAAANSADSASAASGGQMLGIDENNTYVETFSDWTLDETRQAGDTGIVKNDGSSIMGWHVMYFEEWGDPTWKRTVDSTLLSEDLTAWNDAILADTKAELRSGSKYLGG